MIRARSAWALGAAGVALAIAVAWSTRAAEGRAAMVEADAALARGDLDAAMTAARVAAEARCPTCDAPERGYALLARIARDAEAKGDDARAFAAFVTIRAAALATTTIGADPRRTEAERELARLGHKIDATAALAGGAPSAAATEERLQRTLATTGVPSGATFLLVAIGAVMFALGAVGLARAPALRATDALVALGGVAVAALALALF